LFHLPSRIDIKGPPACQDFPHQAATSAPLQSTSFASGYDHVRLVFQTRKATPSLSSASLFRSLETWSPPKNHRRSRCQDFPHQAATSAPLQSTSFASGYDHVRSGRVDAHFNTLSHSFSDSKSYALSEQRLAFSLSRNLVATEGDLNPTSTSLLLFRCEPSSPSSPSKEYHARRHRPFREPIARTHPVHSLTGSTHSLGHHHRSKEVDVGFRSLFIAPQE
jgi:hypothetical protein